MLKIDDSRDICDLSIDENKELNLDFFEDYTKEDEDKRQEQELPMWDTFKCSPPKQMSGSMTQSKFYEIAMRGVKMLVYLILFGFTLIGGVCAKSSILFVTSNINDRKKEVCTELLDLPFNEQNNISTNIPIEEQVLWMWCIVLCFSIPETIGFFNSLFICIFKNFDLPASKNWIHIILIEILNTIGLALFFLMILPSVDILKGATLSSCVCFVPAVLAMLSRFNYNQLQKSVLIVDILVLFIQLFGMIYYTFDDNDSSIPTWILPVVLFLISIRWWPNYVALDSNITFIRNMAKVRESLRPNRHFIQVFTSILRVSTFFLAAIGVAHYKGIEPQTFLDGIFWQKYNMTFVRNSSSIADFMSTSSNDYVPFEVDPWFIKTLMIIHITSAILVYGCGKFACRTLMQKFGFALPINLITPTTVCFLIVVCVLQEQDKCFFDQLIPNYVFYNFSPLHTVDETLRSWFTWLWLLWPLSQAWITIHTWKPVRERLAATEQIFCLPMYDSLIIDQSLALNRRRYESCDVLLNEESNSSTCNYNSVSTLGVNYEDTTTKIYACATMWHETESEMNELMGSILRLDMDQCAMRFFKQEYKINVRDYYELEIHIFFDDAFYCMYECSGKCKHKEDETHVNCYVMIFIEAVEKIVKRLRMQSTPPVKYPTPYGGRLLWILPGKTKMFVHLKDKNKIRHRKRWSQVMYMYYLLGFRLMELPIEKERRQVLAENTYILTLDGDIDFRPSAVKTLVDLMKRDKDLGAACGRIHPVGKGPIVWYQKFEYAVGHWLQKSTEHVIGCVLCCPGCFSLFRAKALMENNVLNKYATRATEARHYVQYDQGEDRWLCTLILQMGYKVEYSAASDAYTHAPETFHEFFVQRRRWIPSTIANILDLLETAKETRKLNNDITLLYIIYQWFLMGSTIIGPGTIFLMLVGAFVATFPIDQWSSFAYNLIPLLIFVITCFFCKESTQLTVAAIITTFYGLVMVVVLVGIMIQIAEDGWVAPSTLLFFIVAGQLIIAGLLHPQESSCLLSGIIYYITVPSMYMILIIFSLFNVNNVTWGTREKKPVENINEDTDQSNITGIISQVNENKKQKGAFEFSLNGLFKCMFCTHDDIKETTDLNNIKLSLNKIELCLSEMERNRYLNTNTSKLNSEEHLLNVNSKESNIENIDMKSLDEELDDDNSLTISTDTELSKAYSSQSACDNFLVSPYWLQDKRLQNGETDFLSTDEETFWRQLIKKYLHPLDSNKQEQDKISEDLKGLRDEFLFKFFMINALFVLCIFLMQLNKDMLHLEWPFGITYNVTYDSNRSEVQIIKNYLPLEPIGCLFIVGFISILLIQFLAMLLHRFNTFAHLMTKVSIECYCCDKKADISEEAIFEKHAHTIVQNLQKIVDADVTIFEKNNHALESPGRRKTVYELDNARKPTATHANFMSLFRENLDYFECANSGSLSADKNQRDVTEMLQKRRTTVINQRFSHRHKSGNQKDTIFLNRKIDQPIDEEQFIYVNEAFQPDDL